MRPRIMLRPVSTALAFAGVLFANVSARAAETLAFSEIAGWWVAEPTFAGESSRVVLHFLEENGKQSARLSLLAIGGYDAPIGTVAITGMTLDMQPFAFPLRFDPERQTLSGHLPEAAVPVYRIPVEFRRTEPLAKPAPPTWNHPRPRVKWTYETGAAVWAGIERDASSRRLFVANDAGVVHAIDADGKESWTFATGKAIKARPAVIGDSVYVASDAGFLFKLDKRSGKEHWRAKIDTGSPDRIPTDDPKTRWDRYGSSVVADGKRVFVASRDKNLYALDVVSGKELWRLQAGDLMTATPALYQDMVLVADFKGLVQALGAADGKVRWMFDAKLPVAGDLAIDGDRVFVGSRTYDLFALDARTGRELWKRYYWFSWIESPPVVRGQVVYTGSSDGTGVFAINAADGSLRWKAAVPGWAWARTAVDDALVVAGTVGRGVYPGVRAGSLVGIERASGKIQWLHLDPPQGDAAKVEWGFGASPLVVDGTVYAADLNGRVLALQWLPPE